MLNQDEIIKAQTDRKQAILSGFMLESVGETREIEMTKASFEKARVDMNLEVYDLDGLNTFKSNIRKASENGCLSEEDLQKAELGLGRLIKVVIVDEIEKGLNKKTITDKNGKVTTVWVTSSIESKKPTPKLDKTNKEADKGHKLAKEIEDHNKSITKLEERNTILRDIQPSLIKQDEVATLKKHKEEMQSNKAKITELKGKIKKIEDSYSPDSEHESK
ncbi:MAG: hypothetical protein A3F91_12360 [Flavobacteria bacterium RIFCSPLOWO2_12_FULL_35_11]|nr:MAG: hypothetical protein A3F91_12360 [Flavobacteria bacterium RIFCSPLOWO2_12_FULL_35_11]